MDWFDDVRKNFEHSKVLKTLKADKFYGSVEVNFNGGVAQTVNVKQSIRAEAKK